MNYLLIHQLDLMMVLEGICGFIFVFLQFMKIDNLRKKRSFIQISFFACVLLLSDRMAYIYRGNESELGYWIVRISNFMVFASIILVENGFNNYLLSLVDNDSIKAGLLSISRAFAFLGLALLVNSQFTGLYYTFDETNHYQRSDGFVICYLVPLIITVIQFIYILKNKIKFRRKIFFSLIIFAVLPALAGIVQIFFYGLSLNSISVAISAITIYFFALSDQNSVLNQAARREIERAKEVQETATHLLNQTVEALVTAVDAKDTYTHGHSNRVAKYSKKIAKMSGMSEKECDDVYLAGLLHDVGKIGIENDIINKTGKLSYEEFNIVKQHPILGGDILSKILISPLLSVGARYHHERYDGHGYPDGLKGEDIPQVARIIAVADAYDAMTSKRSYRDTIPQMYVREELVKGMGTQFDPNFAKIMLHLLDRDEEYMMKENRFEEVFGADLSYTYEEYKTNVSVGIRITDCPLHINIKYKSLKRGGIPTLLLYDSADARYYLEDNSLAEEMDFIEFARIRVDGDIWQDYIRDARINICDNKLESSEKNCHNVSIMMVKKDDHILVKMINEENEYEIILAQYDASRYTYLAFTGEYCSLDIVDVDIATEVVGDDYIPRIAEKISYIDKPAGDIPNIQVDGWKSAFSKVMNFTDDIHISFHTMSLPSSRRVWHCPIICLFTSDDGIIGGSNYREIAVARLDGEVWCEDSDIINNTVTSKADDFENWSIWKQRNKAGVDCELSLSHKSDIVNLQVENSGLTTINQTKLQTSVDKVYFYFTGDQCAITNICVNRDINVS